MTDMHRLTISLPNELAERIYALRVHPEYRKSSFSELIRVLLTTALEAGSDETQTA